MDRGSIPLRSTKKDVERKIQHLFFIWNFDETKKWILLRKCFICDKLTWLCLGNILFQAEHYILGDDKNG